MKKIINVIAVVMLTAGLGRIQYDNHFETWYNLPMDRVLEKAAANGIEIDYWERADGMKMNGVNIIVAANYDIHPYGSYVETSRGRGIVLDTGDFAKKEPTTIDIATTW